LIERQVQDPKWGAYATKLLDGAFRHPRSGKHNDQAHPPIHPVRAALNLSGEEQKVFEFITRRFLACCSHEARGNGTAVTARINTETFKVSGLTITELNYLEVYPYDKWTSTMISPFVLHENLQPTLSLPTSHTTPPSLLTESDLINLMDKSGIGTDATIHEHIAKILDRDYTNKEGEYFVPTMLGMSLISGYDAMNMYISLSRPDLRALVMLLN
jgi:DNA topoisomerase-3